MQKVQQFPKKGLRGAFVNTTATGNEHFFWRPALAWLPFGGEVSWVGRVNPEGGASIRGGGGVN